MFQLMFPFKMHKTVHNLTVQFSCIAAFCNLLCTSSLIVQERFKSAHYSLAVLKSSPTTYPKLVESWTDSTKNKQTEDS
jgi:hypothetical protein